LNIVAAPVPQKKIKITSPEKVAELLGKVAASGCPLLIKALSMPDVSVRGRAFSMDNLQKSHQLKIGNLSANGLVHLAKHSPGGVQVEFILAAIKIVFVTTLSSFTGLTCLVNYPKFLESVERRKEARIPAIGNSRAYLSLDSWIPDTTDPSTVPFFESSKEFAPLIQVGDVSNGGLSVLSTFPAICRALSVSERIQGALFHLPMQSPIKVMISVRWAKKTVDIITSEGDQDRSITTFKFGIQFENASEAVKNSLKAFLATAALADAI
jgi:hypothetical protein